MIIITIVYTIGMWLFRALIMAASPFNEKAKQLNHGLCLVWQKLHMYVNDTKCIWIHVASLGEFEQGRPLIEAIKEKYPNRKIVLTFFSPSGYEVRHNYNLADLVCYLPLDGPINAHRFVNMINPEVAFFVKYEFWHFYLDELHRRNIPVYGVSMIFRKQQQFFKPLGGWFRHMLRDFKHIYIQNSVSAELLDSINIKNYSIVGDTRFDRVAKIAAASADYEVPRAFSQNSRVIVAGSSWAPDEDILIEYINNAPQDVKLILAPHEIDEEHIKQIVQKIKVPYSLMTAPAADYETQKVLIVNTIGMLSAIYKYGQIAYLGGGFGKGIHNTLEAATYGMPVIFGPKYKKFKEACDLIEWGAAFTINNYNDFNNVLDNLWSDIQRMETSKKQASQYVKSMCGATDAIIADVFGK